MPKKQDPISRFKSHTRRIESGCIEWTAYRGKNGYGRFYFEGRGALAHRWAYEHFVGPIPEGLVIDHLCRNHACVNPEHLEPVTTSVNVLRGVAPERASEYFARRTHCPKGHEYTRENTYVNRKGRNCLACKKERARESYLADRDRVIERSAEWRRTNLERARELSREGQRRYRAAKKKEAA